MLMLLLALHTPRPAAPPARFHLVNKSTVVIGDGAQTIVMTLSAFVSVTTRDSADGQLAHVLIDSTTFDAGDITAMLPPQLLESAKGTSLDAFFRNGKAVQLTPSAAIAQTMQLAPAVQLLLVGTRMTKAGDTWVDTTRSDTTIASGTAKGSQITAWTATTNPAGGMDLTGTVHGTTSVGGMMQMEMQITGTSHVTGMPGTLPRSAASSGSGEATANVGGGSMVMKVVNDVTVTAIP